MKIDLSEKSSTRAFQVNDRHVHSMVFEADGASLTSLASHCTHLGSIPRYVCAPLESRPLAVKQEMNSL